MSSLSCLRIPFVIPVVFLLWFSEVCMQWIWIMMSWCIWTLGNSNGWNGEAVWKTCNNLESPRNKYYQVSGNSKILQKICLAKIWGGNGDSQFNELVAHFSFLGVWMLPGFPTSCECFRPWKVQVPHRQITCGVHVPRPSIGLSQGSLEDIHFS